MKKLLVLLAVGVVAPWILAPAASAADATVELTPDNRFDPSTISVEVGDTVTFRWEGGFHNVVFDDGTKSGEPVDQDGLEWSRTFSASGTYSFVCEVHESIGMKGTITVADAAGGGDTSGGGGNDQGGGGQEAGRSYPYTGPESALLPGIGALMLTGGGAGLLLRRRRGRGRR